VKKVDVAFIHDALVCYVNVFKVDHNGAMFRFAGGCFIFASKRSNFGYGTAWEAIGSFK